MRCPACSFENASGIKFCGECGTSLKAKCASCGFENGAGPNADRVAEQIEAMPQ